MVATTKGGVFRLHRAFLPPDAEEEPTRFIPGEIPRVKQIGPGR
jgi:hypothetical protein